jgi:hypothetical protein
LRQESTVNEAVNHIVPGVRYGRSARALIQSIARAATFVTVVYLAR